MPKVALTMLIATGLLILPSPAAAAYLIPPGNSAANQYTEAFPTASGNKGARAHSQRKPAKVLGHAKAQRLQARGPDGAAVAVLTAATAPPQGPPEKASKPGAGKRGKVGIASGHPLSGEGSSGASEVVGQATGLFSGASGFLIPLTMLFAALWAAAYLWSRRQQPA